MKNFISSQNIQVYPTAYREGYNPTSSLNTEYNITTLITRLTDKDSFVIHANKVNNKIKDIWFSLLGYWFYADITELYDADYPKNQNDYTLYANIEIVNNSYEGDSFIVPSLANYTHDTVTVLDDSDGFKGVKFTQSPDTESGKTIYSLKIIDKDGNIPEESFIKIGTHAIANTKYENNIPSIENETSLNRLLKSDNIEVNTFTASQGIIVDENKYLKSKDFTDTFTPTVSSGDNVYVITDVQQDAYGTITPVESTLPAASASNAGVISTGAQTISGVKTFTSQPKIRQQNVDQSIATENWVNARYLKKVGNFGDSDQLLRIETYYTLVYAMPFVINYGSPVVSYKCCWMSGLNAQQSSTTFLYFTSEKDLMTYRIDYNAYKTQTFAQTFNSLTNCELVPFATIPVGPNQDPTQDNQFTRKKYVDSKSQLFTYGVASSLTKAISRETYANAISFSFDTQKHYHIKIHVKMSVSHVSANNNYSVLCSFKDSSQSNSYWAFSDDRTHSTNLTPDYWFDIDMIVQEGKVSISTSVGNLVDTLYNDFKTLVLPEAPIFNVSNIKYLGFNATGTYDSDAMTVYLSIVEETDALTSSITIL